MKTSPPTATAFSYVRFSSPEQRKGDSLRRQTKAAEDWCEKNGVPLDTSLTLHDKGCSAFKGLHRENPDKHALALFLKLVERGRVRPGDLLVIENLDRLTREEEVTACDLLTGILVAGVKVVQLSPYEMVLTDKSNGWELMRAVMELSRGHGESALKSQRVDAAWQKRLARTRAGEVILTRNLPAWVEERGGKLRLIPARAAAVRRIYQLAAAGYGQVRIVKTLVAEGAQPFGGWEEYEDEDGNLRRRAPEGDRYGCKQWTKSYIHKILRDRRAVGEFQPQKADGTSDGPPLPGYYPAAVSPELWDAARAGAVRRAAANGHKTNNSSKYINIFAGLVRDARDGGTVICDTRTARGGRHTRILLNSNGQDGRVSRVTFPYATFEAGLLSLLAEVSAADVLGEDEAPSAVAVLSGEKARVEAELDEAEAFMNAEGFSVAIGKRVKDLEARLAEVVEQLAEAQRQAARPLAESWGEARGLMMMLNKAADPDDVRIRLRTALRRTVESIWLLVVPRGRHRLAAVQVWFAGGRRRRDYLLLHRAPWGGAGGNRREARWWARSLSAVVKPGDLDLRRPEDARALESLLTKIAITELDA
jgi:DNA invertase Pin-like site-specific DNA recombinase